MEQLLWFIICFAMTSWCPKPVTSTTTSVPKICCPVEILRHNVYVYCRDLHLEHFRWSALEQHVLDEERKQICVKTGTADPSKKDGSKASDWSILWLDLSGNSLTSFPDLSHPNLSDLFHLNLSDNRISEVPRSGGLFGKDLEVLDMSHNALSLMPDFARIQLPRLTVLNLSHNAVQDLPLEVFQGVPHLKHLWISHNQVRKVTFNSFADLSSLVDMDLSFNLIDTLPARVFDDLKQLSVLDLSANDLESVPELVFKNLAHLQSLNLSHNKLTQISHGSLVNLKSLTILDLSSNQIENIPGQVFEDLTKLVRLHLAHNKVKAISKETVKGLEALQVFDLSYNQLTTVRKASFVSLKNLLRMELKSNKLKRLHEHAFAGLPWLEHLDLSHNELQLDLQMLPEDLFSPLVSLRNLFLDNNDLRSAGTYPATLFTSLHQLRHLSIDTFSDTTFDEAFEPLTALKRLDLPNCKMKYLTDSTFRGLERSSLERLSLTGCPLQAVEKCAFCALHGLEQLTLTDRRFSSAAAARPLKLNGRLLGPDNSYLRRLNLSNMNLHPDTFRSLNHHTLKNLDGLEVLDLSHNNLSDVNFTMKAGVKELLLSGNRFQAIPVDLKSFKRLHLVDMRDNNISFLTPTQRSALDSFPESAEFTVLLRGNPVSCLMDDCTAQDFLRWLCKTRVRLDGAPQSGCSYSCLRGQGKVATVEEALRSCERNQEDLVWKFLTTALLSVLVTVILYRKRSTAGVRSTMQEEAEEDLDSSDFSLRGEPECDQFKAPSDVSLPTECSDLEKKKEPLPEDDPSSGFDDSFLTRFTVDQQTIPKEPVQALSDQSPSSMNSGIPTIQPMSASLSLEETLPTDFKGLAEMEELCSEEQPSRYHVLEHHNARHQTVPKEPVSTVAEPEQPSRYYVLEHDNTRHQTVPKEPLPTAVETSTGLRSSPTSSFPQSPRPSSSLPSHPSSSLLRHMGNGLMGRVAVEDQDSTTLPPSYSTIDPIIIKVARAQQLQQEEYKQ